MLKKSFTRSCKQLHGIPMAEEGSAETVRLPNGNGQEGL
jgi:hypothetical protein